MDEHDMKNAAGRKSPITIDFKRNDCCALYKGLLHAFLSSVFHSLCCVLAKYIKEISAGQLTVYIFTGMFSICLPVITYKNIPVCGLKTERPYLLTRAVLGSVNNYLTFLSFKHLPIGEASVILFSFPVLVSIMARFIFKERCSCYQVLAVILTFVGLVVTSKIPFETQPGTPGTNRLVGLSSAFASAALTSSMILVLRKLQNTNEYMTLFVFSCVGIVINSTITACFEEFNVPNCGLIPWLIVLFVAFNYLSQFFMTSALRVEQSGGVATIRASCDIALNLVWEVIFLKTVPEITSVAGAVLVCSSIVLIFMHKTKQK